MSKRPTDDYEPAAKKRGSGRQLTKDDASDDEVEEKGSIETATEDVMKGRRVLKARRAGGGAPPPAAAAGATAPPAAANPFSGVSLTGGAGGGNGFAALASAQPAEKAEAQEPSPAAEPAEASKPADAAEASAPAEPASSAGAAAEPKLAAADAERAEPGAGKEQAGGAAAPAFASFASTAAPFAATAGSRPLFNFGTVAASGGDSSGGGAFSFSGAAGGGPAPFSFKAPEGGFPSVQSIFGAGAPADQQNGGGEEEGGRGLKPALASLPPEAVRTTGEEGEATLWAGEGTLYEFSAARAWAERGRGELRLNRAPGQAARFVMRQKGYLRLLMNARLWPGMAVSRMDGGKGATFPVVNAVPGPDDKDGDEPRLRTFAFRLKSAGQLDAFIAAAEAHKGAAEAPPAAAGGDAPAAGQAAQPAEAAQP